MQDGLQVLIVQRGFDVPSGQPRWVLRQTSDQYNTYFDITVDSTGQDLGSYKHGQEFLAPIVGHVMPVTATNNDTGDQWHLTLQPYTLVCTDHNIMHFYHERDTETVWAIGDSADGTEVHILKSSDYFNTYQQIYSWPSSQFQGFYRSMYIDQYGNIIVGNRPSPLISRDGGNSFSALPFEWQDPDHGILSPFWNITESETEGLLVISEYGDSLSDTQPHGSHRGTFWSYDQSRTHWVARTVDQSFDRSDYMKFGGYFRHIHGYHINPYNTQIHLMFLGDPAQNSSTDGTPGYYVSQDGGHTWSTECLTQYDPDFFYNGPCFATWWPNGKAFITSDTADTGHEFWWGNGPNSGVGQDTWGGPGLNWPAIELGAMVDREAASPETPWMAMAVRGAYETYCTTSTNGQGSKEVVWRYDGDSNNNGDSGTVTWLAENYLNDPNNFSTLKWLSGSRNNMIPSQAQYFFTAGGRRFPRSA